MTLNNYSCIPAAEVFDFLVDNGIDFSYRRGMVWFAAEEQVAADLHVMTGMAVVNEDNPDIEV